MDGASDFRMTCRDQRGNHNVSPNSNVLITSELRVVSDSRCRPESAQRGGRRLARWAFDGDQVTSPSGRRTEASRDFTRGLKVLSKRSSVDAIQSS